MFSINLQLDQLGQYMQKKSQEEGPFSSVVTMSIATSLQYCTVTAELSDHITEKMLRTFSRGRHFFYSAQVEADFALLFLFGSSRFAHSADQSSNKSNNQTNKQTTPNKSGMESNAITLLIKPATNQTIKPSFFG